MFSAVQESLDTARVAFKKRGNDRQFHIDKLQQ